MFVCYSFKTATLKSMRKLATVARESQEEHPRNGLSRNTAVIGLSEDYITQVSQETENRVTKNLSKKFIRTESQILGTLFKLNEFLLYSQIRALFGTAPITSRNSNAENQEANDDCSQNSPSPERGTSIFRLPQSMNSDPDEASDTLLIKNAS